MNPFGAVWFLWFSIVMTISVGVQPSEGVKGFIPRFFPLDFIIVAEMAVEFQTKVGVGIGVVLDLPTHLVFESFLGFGRFASDTGVFALEVTGFGV